MNLLQLKESAGIEGLAALAKVAGTNQKYLSQCAHGHRKPSPRLAKKLAAADRRLTLAELRPDIYTKAA